MGNYTAFYDASRSEQTVDQPLVVAGLVSTVAKWIQVDSAWTAVLDAFGVPYLHMKEFAHSQPHSPYESWKGNERKRAAFLNRLINALKGRVEYGTVVTVVPADFHAVDKRYVLADQPRVGPYTFLALHARMIAEKWVTDRHSQAECFHVFEKGDTGQGQLAAAIQWNLDLATILPKVSPTTGKWHIPFQAADLVAYEYRLGTERWLKGQSHQLRESFLAIRDALPIEPRRAGQKELFETCRSLPDLYPPRPA
jgi:hypothetical protein